MKRFKVKIVVVVVILIVMVPKHSWNKEYKLYATAQRKTSGTTSNLQQQSKNTREREREMPSKTSQSEPNIA